MADTLSVKTVKMRVIFSKSASKPAEKEASSDKRRHKNANLRTASLVKVQDAPSWSELNIRGAANHVGPFLEYMKNNHDEENPAFSSQLLVAMDNSDADQDAAIAALRDYGSIISFTDLLALLGPAVEYALALINDPAARTPANIERFVLALVLALAEATNEFGDEELIPLDADLIDGITVTVRNILHAYRKDFDKINYGGQVNFFGKLITKFGGRCFAGCTSCCRKQ